MNVLQRALNAIRQAVMPTAWAPSAPPGQPGGSPSVTPARTTPIATPRAPIVGQIPAGGLALSGTQPAFMTAPPPTALQRAIAPVQTFLGDVGQGLATPGGALDPVRAARNIAAGAAGGGLIGAPLMGIGAIPGAVIGGATGLAAEILGLTDRPAHGQTPQFTPGVGRMVDVAPPSQPDTITPERRNITPIPPAPTLPGDFQTRTAVLPQAPTLAPGTFQGQAPAPAGPATRAPIMTPGTAPTPAMTPPAPFMMGGGGDREAIIGGGINIPTEAPLPPARVLPGDLGGQAPLGQFDAMIRSLQARQGLPSRFVQMPMEGASPFGFAGAQERAIRRLRDRELGRAF